ncbi:MAG TPA: putative zinc-binding metallopeptidase [Gemmatimonadaceae bacterium]|nr:putative zinc-binding metallopeptidase [Gemmatimonadaceae bacterium]
MARVRDELARTGIRLRPHVWLGEEWFSPSNVPGFAVPFYLAHPRLMRLERAQMGGVEGGTVRECLAIMRHETGHTVQHAYQLQRRRRWQQLFGRASRPYPDHYRPDRESRRHVRYLRYWYAQSHPVEDFAETFAVWLDPASHWRRRYAEWPRALRKLEYVDALIRDLGARAPRVRSRAMFEPLHRLDRTLGDHYAQRRQRYRIGPREWRHDWIAV